jgi:hypothetical protein
MSARKQFAPYFKRMLPSLRRNARQYQDPNGRGQRLNVSAICVMFGISPSGFNKGYSRRLEPLVMRFNARNCRPVPEGKWEEKTYLEKDVAAMIGSRARPIRFMSSDDPTRFTVGDTEVYTLGGVLGALDLAAPTLKSFRTRFPFWNPDLLLFRPATSPVTNIRVLTCPVANVELAAKKLEEARTGRVVLPDGKAYLSPYRTVLEIWGFQGRNRPSDRTAASSDRWKVVKRWIRERCAWLGGRKLAAARLPNLNVSFGRSSPYWPLEDDVLRIKAVAARTGGFQSRRELPMAEDSCKPAAEPGPFLERPAEIRTHWAASKHDTFAKWDQDGSSLEEIARRWNREHPTETITKSGVAKALSRRRKRPSD